MTKTDAIDAEIDDVQRQLAEHLATQTIDIPEQYPPEPIRLVIDIPPELVPPILVLRAGQRDALFMTIDAMRRHLALHVIDLLRRPPRIDTEQILERIVEVQADERASSDSLSWPGPDNTSDDTP